MHTFPQPAGLRTGNACTVPQPAPPSGSVQATLAYRPPYAVDALTGFLAARAVPGVEAAGPRHVRRTLRAGALGTVHGAPSPAGWLEVEFCERSPQVRLRFAPAWWNCSARVMAAVRRWLDLDAQPDAIDTALAGLPGPPGQRLPGSLDAFELAVRAVLGQQVRVAAARTLAQRLVVHFGTPLATPWTGIDRTFPAPETLAQAPLDGIAALGLVRQRAQAVQALAQAWPTLEPQLLPGALPQDVAALVERLCALPGIGPWTAHYIAMRALGWPDAFPPGDVAVLNAMQRHCGPLRPRQCEDHAAAWRPWRSYAVLRLWNSLETPP